MVVALKQNGMLIKLCRIYQPERRVLLAQAFDEVCLTSTLLLSRNIPLVFFQVFLQRPIKLYSRVMELV